MANWDRMKRRGGRLLLVLAALLCGLLLLMLNESQPDLGAVRATPVAEPASPPSPPPSPPPAVPEPAPEPPPPPPRHTRFVARLLLGDRLLPLRGRANAAEMREVLAGGVQSLLRADGTPPRDPFGALDFLCEPRRDTGALLLANAGEDAIGSDLPIRVWTLGAGYPDAPIARAEEMLAQLAQVAGAGIEGGVDVLATPEVGGDVFPAVKAFAELSDGVYWGADEFCTVRSTLVGARAEQVLRHELVHAFLLRTMPRFTHYRFVGEGLAEYLRLLVPTDKDLYFPARRLADNLAWLERALVFFERHGYRFDRVSFRNLVRLDPREFYSMPLGYPLAQAAMAFIGGDVVAKALRSRADREIVAAVSAIGWSEFRAFIREHGSAGRPSRAIHVHERDPELEAWEGALQWRVVRAVGIDVPDRAADRGLPTGDFSDPDRVAEVLRTLLESGAKIVVATDLSAEMDRAMPGLTLAAATLGTSGEGLDAPTPRDFVAGLFARFVKPALVGLVTDQARVKDLRTELPYDSLALAETLAANGWQECGLVVCGASKLGLAPEELGWRYRQQIELLRRWGIRPVAVLAFSFAGDEGDAAFLALAFATRGLGLDVALWQPSPR